MRRKLAIAFGIALSATFLWLAIRDSDLASIRSAFASVNPVLVGPFLLCLFAFYWLKTTRWKNILSPVLDTQSRDLFSIIMVGYAGTAVLPLQMGEFIRAYIAGRRYSLPFAPVFSSIAIERVFDLLTILFLLGVALVAGQSTPEVLMKSSYIVAALAVLGLLVSLALVKYTDKSLTICRIILAPLPAHVTNLILAQLESAVHGVESVAQPRLLAWIAMNSIVQWSIMGLCIWCSLLAFDISIPVSGAILVLVATIIGISLPSSPGHIGNVQLAFVVALSPFDVEPAQAIAASLFYHSVAYLTVVAAGLYFLQATGYGLLELQKKSRVASR